MFPQTLCELHHDRVKDVEGKGLMIVDFTIDGQRMAVLRDSIGYFTQTSKKPGNITPYNAQILKYQVPYDPVDIIKRLGKLCTLNNVSIENAWHLRDQDIHQGVRLVGFAIVWDMPGSQTTCTNFSGRPEENERLTTCLELVGLRGCKDTIEVKFQRMDREEELRALAVAKQREAAEPEKSESSKRKNDEVEEGEEDGVKRSRHREAEVPAGGATG